MKVLLLLLLAGFCSGLQFPLQYVYHYRAKVSSGIPDINKRHSAVSELKANLTVYVTSATRVVFKLSDVSFADTNGQRECDHGMGQSVVTQQASQLGQFPFALETGLLTFNAEEKPWAINFYKSIVSLFNIPPLKEAFHKTSPNHNNSEAYDVIENTVMGTCRTTYTQHKLTGVAAAQRELFGDHHVTRDVQRVPLGGYTNPGSSKTTKTTGGQRTSAGVRRKRQASKRPASKTSKPPPRIQQAPALSNTLWEVVRSVNLEDCLNRVEHQHSFGGLHCLLSKDQCQNLFSRNSHGVFNLRGDANGMRLEKAMVKGAIVISPFGFETEHIETVTNQILALVSVNHLDIDTPNLTGDRTVTKDSLLYELTLPYEGTENTNFRWAKMGTMKETIAALTGVLVTEDVQRSNEVRVTNMVKLAAELSASGNAESTQKVPVLLNYASILMYDFTKAEITRVATGLQQASLDLFSGVLAEVGSAPAVDVMLELIKTGKVSALRQVLYFGALNMNIKSAASLRPLLNFVKSQNLDEAPFKTSQSLINFASVVKKLCLGRRDASNSFTEFAYQRCAKDGIVADLRQYLASELQGAEEFWKQMVLVQALVSLTSVESTNALLPYVLGVRNCDTMVRVVAMDSLAKWNTASPLNRTKIVLILLDIFENPAEHRMLRARALGYLGSWDLTSTEWTRLAFTTKRHGLKDLAALTYSLIKSTADYKHPEMIQQRQYARHALSLAKPSSAADRYSSIKAWFNYNFDSQIGQMNYFSQVKDPMSPLPAMLEVYIQRSLGGAMIFRKLDFMIANDNGDLEDIVRELLLDGNAPPRDDSSRGRWTTFLNMLKTDLNIETKVRTAIRGLTHVMSQAEARIFVPFERVMLDDAIKSLSGKWGPGVTLTGPTSLYINSVDKTFTTINDLGLPVITNVARPSIVSFKGSANFIGTNDREYTLSTESFGVLVSSFFRVNIETMIPWSHTKVAAGVSNTCTVNLPFSATVKFSLNRDKRKRKFLIVNVAPSVFAKTALLTKVNMPYTLIRDTAPADLNAVTEALKIVYVNGEGPKYQKTRALPYTTLEETYATDFNVGFSYEDAVFRSSSGSEITLEQMALFPNLMFFSSAISTDLTGLRTFSVRLNFTSVMADRLSNAGKLVSKYGQDSFEDYELCGSEESGDSFTQQTGQQASSGDYIDEQDSQSAQNPEQEFESFGSFGEQQSQVPARLSNPTEAETVRPSQGIGDVSQPQLGGFLKYLQQQAGWKSWVNGVSVRLEVLKGAVVALAFEAVAANTKCYALVDQVLDKSVLVIARSGDPCDTLCFESEVIRPKINDLDTLPLLLAKNLNLTRKIEVYTGRKCSDGPVQSVTRKLSVTAAGRQSLVNHFDDLQKCGCPWGRPKNLVKEFAETAEYDRLEYTYNIKKVDNIQCKSPFLQLFLTQGWSTIRRTVFNLKKDFEICPAEIGPTGIQKSGVAKSLGDGTWSWEETLGQKKLTQTTEALPFWVDDSVKIGFQSDYEGRGEYCVIDGQKMTTFDGRRVNFTTSACSVLVSTPCEGHTDVFAVAVKTSSSGGLAVQIVGQVKQFIINVNPAGIDVNGVAMKADEYVKALYYTSARGQQIAGYIYRRNRSYKVEIDDTVNVLLKEGNAYIEVADRYRGYMCGMCGNFDDEPSNDLKAPNGCLITHSEQFAKAWTPSVGFECTAEQETNPASCLKEEPLPHDYYQQYQL